MPEEKVSGMTGRDGICPHCVCYFDEVRGIKCRCTPAADAGPRQPNRIKCHYCEGWADNPRDILKHELSEHTDESIAAPPVPQEAAPQPISYVETAPGIWQGPVGPRATAPDSAMRVAEKIVLHYVSPEGHWTFPSKENLAALIREAGSERERELEQALTVSRDTLVSIKPQVKGVLRMQDVDLAIREASRLLGWESKV